MSTGGSRGSTPFSSMCSIRSFSLSRSSISSPGSLTGTPLFSSTPMSRSPPPVLANEATVSISGTTLLAALPGIARLYSMVLPSARISQMAGQL